MASRRRRAYEPQDVGVNYSTVITAVSTATATGTARSEGVREISHDFMRICARPHAPSPVPRRGLPLHSDHSHGRAVDTKAPYGLCAVERKGYNPVNYAWISLTFIHMAVEDPP